MKMRTQGRKGRHEWRVYLISKASPYAKNRYFSFIAWLYASMIKSCPANAELSINKVLCGVWKFVISASEILKSYLGKMNLLVQPLYGFSVN